MNLLHSVRSSDDGHDKSLDFLFFTPLKKKKKTQRWFKWNRQITLSMLWSWFLSLERHLLLLSISQTNYTSWDIYWNRQKCTRLEKLNYPDLMFSSRTWPRLSRWPEMKSEWPQILYGCNSTTGYWAVHVLLVVHWPAIFKGRISCKQWEEVSGGG